MKRFILKILLFFIVVLCIDILFGITCKYTFENTKGRDTKRDYYIAKGTNEEILIMGSSKAARHFNPKILSDSLNMAAFNCGEPGNGIIHSFGLYQLIIDRYNPKILIYELTGGFDIKDETYDQNLKYLNKLKRFYHDTIINQYYNHIAPKEILKMQSNLFRYNNHAHALIFDYLRESDIPNNGFMPMPNSVKINTKAKRNTENKGINKWDSLKLECFKNMIKTSKERGIKLIFTISPYFGAKTSYNEYHLIQDLCKRENIIILDYCADTTINTKTKYYSDFTHLNKSGANEYTKKIASDIKRILNQQD